MVKTERMIAYTKLPSEGRMISTKPKESWPRDGAIVYKNVSFAYSLDEPHVLKNISFEIRPCEKVKKP